MSPCHKEPAASAQTLLLLDHRGAELDPLRIRLQDRGWRVRFSRAPEHSATLLDESPAAAAVIAPLTLSPLTSEWRLLLPRLSPHQGTPWLLLPWSDARPSRFAELALDPDSLADWLPHPYEPAEAEARIQQLIRMAARRESHEAKRAELLDQLIADHKTGLANDRHFRGRLEEEFSRSERHGAPLSLLLLDVDNFKKINDTANYEFGDTVLRAIAGVIEQSIRNIDLAARIGGDEFGILMPNTNLEEGVGVATRILESASSLLVQEGKFSTGVQVSIGSASFDGRGLTASSQFFLRANEALKTAKASGKNRVCFFDPLHRSSSKASQRAD